MNQQQQSLLVDAASFYPRPPGVRFPFGRDFTVHASLLESTAFRMGVLAALRSIQTKSAVGLMIEPSTNPIYSTNQISHNGLKIVEPSGGDLSFVWLGLAYKLVNAEDLGHEFIGVLDWIVAMEKIVLEGAPKGEVLLGRDTRPSGKYLLEAAKQGVTSVMCTTALDMGILPRVQLCWIVRMRNKGIDATKLKYSKQKITSFESSWAYAEPDDSAIISRNEAEGENLAKLILSVENGSRLSRVLPYGFSKGSRFLLLLGFLFMLGYLAFRK